MSRKPVPMDKTIPAMDADRRKNTNISPQGHVKPDDAPHGSYFTAAGDCEKPPKIPASANDPV